MNNIKRNQIVVVGVGNFGNRVGTITKVLSRPNEVNDNVFLKFGKRKHDHYATGLVLCEAVHPMDSPIKYRNKAAWYEDLNGLRPATESEKKEYRKSKMR